MEARKRTKAWSLFFGLSSLSTVQANSIILPSTILSSLIPSSRYHSSLSLSYLSDEVGRLQQLLEDEFLPSTYRDIAIPEFDTDVGYEKCRDDGDEDVDQSIMEITEFADSSEPKVPLTSTTIASLPLNNTFEKRRNESSPVSSISIQAMSNCSTTVDVAFIYSLAMISGFGEICSLKSYGCFTNMVTGASVRMLMGVAEGQFTTINIPICVALGYTSGIMLARIMKYRCDSNEPTILPKSPLSRFDLRTFLLPRTKISVSRKRNPAAVLLWSVTPLILVLFSSAESMNAVLKLITKSNMVRIPLPVNVLLKAIGYGLIAQVLSDVQTIPTNVYVLTGHYVTLAKSIIDQYLKSTDSISSLPIRSRIQRFLAYVPTTQQRQSIHIMIFFGVGTVIASMMYKFCSALLPIQHTLTGVLFVLAFLRYSIRLNNANES